MCTWRPCCHTASGNSTSSCYRIQSKSISCIKGQGKVYHSHGWVYNALSEDEILFARELKIRKDWGGEHGTTVDEISFDSTHLSNQ